MTLSKYFENCLMDIVTKEALNLIKTNGWGSCPDCERTALAIILFNIQAIVIKDCLVLEERIKKEIKDDT